MPRLQLEDEVLGGLHLQGEGAPTSRWAVPLMRPSRSWKSSARAASATG